MAGDKVYSRDGKLRLWLEERQQLYVLAEASDQLLAQKRSTLKALVSVAGRRWAVEISFRMGKSRCGLDHYEIRHWQDGSGTSLCPCWLWPFWRYCAPERKTLPTRFP